MTGKEHFEFRLRAHFAWLRWLDRKRADPDPCCLCDQPGGHARVYMRAWEPALWVPACARHETELALAA